MKVFLESICLFCLIILSASITYAAVPDIVLSQKKAVVTIYVYEGEQQIIFGSGFIIDPTGIIVTNYHVISTLLKNPNTSIAIKMEDSKFIEAEKLIIFDEDRDIALIKVMDKNIPAVNIAPDYEPKQGEDVIVIGSPFGFETTVSTGIISSIRGSDKFLQITAPISPGSSGSPVFNIDGNVIGIATLLVEGGQNLNFAIPVKYIENLIKSKVAKPISALNAIEISNYRILSQAEKLIRAENHVNLAKKLLTKGQWNEAIDEYSKAIALTPDDAAIYYERGKIYLNGFYKVSQALILEQPKPEMPRPEYESHDDYIKYNEQENALYEKAIQDFSKAILLNPNNASYYYDRATTYYRIYKNKEAIEDYSMAITLKHNDGQYYFSRGQVFFRMHQYIKAIDDFNKAMELGTEDSLEYRQLGASYENIGQIDKAIQHYQKMILKNPCASSLFYDLMQLYEKENKFNEAIKYYTKVINDNPKCSALYSERAYFFEKLGQYSEGIKDLDKAIGLEPDNSGLYSQRASFYEELGQYEKAIEDYTTSIEKEPHSIFSRRLYYHRGLLYLKTQKNKQARSDFEKSCSLQVSDACMELNKMDTNEKRGDKWISWSESRGKSFFYDKTSIKQLPNKHIRVWTRMETDNISAYLDERKRNVLPINNYENFSHSLYLYEFDCDKREIGIASSIDYDNQGNVLDGVDKTSLTLRPIVPDSIAEALFIIVCQNK